LKFCVTEFCWLDSTVSTEELDPVEAAGVADDREPEVEDFEPPPQPATAITAATAQHAMPSF
jgi:hypothetical protein